jgi:exopolyphosphatase/guanosine-5'-triphosphate,3'-diphosphate pyrophosphatase
MASARLALGRFQQKMLSLNIKHFRVVATSAVRESKNGDQFIRQVEDRLKLKLEIISGSEEARLVYQAVKHAVALGRRRWLIVNLGGGSVEICLADWKRIYWSESHTLGAVRLLHEFKGSAGRGRRYQQLLTEYIRTMRLQEENSLRGIAGVIMTGGNIEDLAKLTGAPANRPAVIPLSMLRKTIEHLSGLSPRERVQQLHLRKHRADVILPAGLVYEHICSLSGQTRMVVPFVGTKEGLVYDLAESLTARPASGSREKNLMAMALQLGRHYKFDESHGVHVARLAGSLFEQLRPLHRLGEADHRILLAAALLHDIGMFISYKKHHKHSLYLLAQSELPGFTPEEMMMVANVARYHRKQCPQAAHESFSRLAKAGQIRVLKLASLLRIADALDREHVQAVRQVRVWRDKNDLHLGLEGAGMALEQWALTRKMQLFNDVFKTKIKVNSGLKGRRHG